MTRRQLISLLNLIEVEPVRKSRALTLPSLPTGRQEVPIEGGAGRNARAF